MKKIIALCLCLLVVAFCFTSCKYLGTTEEYELYDRFAQKHDVGMTKQEVFDKLGCPDAYYTQTYHNIGYDREAKKEFEANLSSDTSKIWYYHCAELGDSDYYTLSIEFDSEGKQSVQR